MFDFPATMTPPFRLDSWASDYGSSIDLEEDEDEDAPPPEAYVETHDWSRGVQPPLLPRPEKIVFVDGVQRIDAWGRVEQDGRLIEAALATVAVGASTCSDGGASIDFCPAARLLAVSGSCSVAPLTVAAGRLRLVFQPETSNRTGRDGVFEAIRKRRSEMERRLAEERVAPNALVVQDGRLAFDPGQAMPVVGLAKTIHRYYLEPPERDLLFRLQAGERTPVFRITYGDTTRYSWFLRLPFTRPIEHSLSGLVRLETPEIGVDAAVKLADTTAATLPAFASRPQHDPRAPQNLLPVGALEKRLRHEMGDARFIRRLIEDQLARGARQ